MAETIWSDASQSQVEWISEETLRATLDPATLEPLSGEPDALSADEAAELKLRLKHFQDFYDRGTGSRFDGEADACPHVEDPCTFGLWPGEVAKPLAELILEKNEGFAVVAEVEAVEAGWSPRWNLVTSLVSVRTVRPLWSSPNLAETPASFRMLMSGGWLTVSGLRLCRSLKGASDVPRPGDRYFVWGDLNRDTPGVMTQGHKLKVTDNTIDSRCAYCTWETGLSLDLLEARLRAGGATP